MGFTSHSFSEVFCNCVRFVAVLSPLVAAQQAYDQQSLVKNTESYGVPALLTHLYHIVPMYLQACFRRQPCLSVGVFDLHRADRMYCWCCLLLDFFCPMFCRRAFTIGGAALLTLVCLMCTVVTSCVAAAHCRLLTDDCLRLPAFVGSQTLARALSGNYVNFGVFDLYGDSALKDALHIALRMVLSIPLQDIMSYK
eukprot:GHRR01021757.1.p1 GENE.GHRR01021757.1~~GHRR01021757.1.p1  ORF type:complete len:196 (-),score=28.00 GHRR01021757.1:584-1171(-)